MARLILIGTILFGLGKVAGAADSIVDWHEGAKLPEYKLESQDARVQERLGKRLVETVYPSRAWIVPATTVMTPSAYGAEWTDLFLGVGLENRARFNTLPNGTAHVGFGIGDSRIVALETAISSYGLARHGHPYRIGGVSFKAHRYFPEWELGAALGYENAIVWGDPDSGQSLYTVLSKHFLLRRDPTEAFSLLFVHLGVGNGRFRSEGDVTVQNQSYNLFAAAGVRVFQPLSFVVNWTGSDLALGLSLAPFRSFPLVLTFAVVDIAHTAGDGDRQMGMISYGDSWNSPSFLF